MAAISSQHLRSNCNAIAEPSFKTDKSVAKVQLCAGSIRTSGKARHAWIGSSKVRRVSFVQSRILFVLRHKHLEHVFEKLGVETHTAAAAAARKLNLGG